MSTHSPRGAFNRRQLVVAAATSLLVLAALGLWRLAPSNEASVVEPSPTAMATAQDTVGGYPGSAQRQAERVAGYPPVATHTPGPTWTPKPTPAYGMALPPGAVIDWPASNMYWVTADAIDILPRQWLTAVVYRHEGRISVGLLLAEGGGFRRLWDLADATDEAAEVQRVAIDRVSLRTGFQAPVIVVRGAGGAAALVLAVSTTGATVRYRLPWPAPDTAEATIEEVDLTGDGVDEVLLTAAEGSPPVARTRIYHHDDGRGPVEVAIVDGPVQAMDVDADGRYELVHVSSSGRAWLQRWDGERYVDAEELVEPPLPTPVAVRDGGLPALPADLYFMRPDGVWRWPRDGGRIQQIVECPDRDYERQSCRDARVATDGTLVVSPHLGHADEGEMAFRIRDPRDGTVRELAGVVDEWPRWPGDMVWDLSNDGRWLVFLRFQRPPGAAAGPVPDHVEKPAQVVAVDLRAGDREHIVADCPMTPAASSEHAEHGCSTWGIAVTADGGQVAFSNGEGLWLAQVPSGGARRLVDHWFGPNETDVRFYTPEVWSPDGRWLRASVGFYEGRDAVVVDAVDGSLHDVPYSGEYAGPRSDFAWYPDSSALVHARSNDYGHAPTALFRLDLTDPVGVRAILPTLDLGQTLGLFAPAVAGDGSIRFMARRTDDAVYRGNGVFAIGRDGTGWRRLAHLPAAVEDDDYGLSPGTAAWSGGAEAWAFWNDKPAGAPLLVGLGDGSAVWDATGILDGVQQVFWGPVRAQSVAVRRPW